MFCLLSVEKGRGWFGSAPLLGKGILGLWVTSSTPAARAAQSHRRAASGLPVELYLRVPSGTVAQ